MKKIVLVFTILTIQAYSFAQNAPNEQTVDIVTRPPENTRNQHYNSNRAPLQASPFAKLPVGSIKPQGWLLKQLQNQASGICGNLMELSRYCATENNAWLVESNKLRPNNSGGWEEAPYWLKGYGDMAYILGDEILKSNTQQWIEALLASQREDGWFGPESNLRSKLSTSTYHKSENLKDMPDLWPNALMLSALRSNYEHTKDKRIIKHMLAYCDWLIALPENHYLVHLVAKKRGVEILKNLIWLYNTTGDEKLLPLLEKNHKRSLNWVDGIMRWHNVDFSECFYEPALYSTISVDPKHYQAMERNFDEIYSQYGQVPGGMFGGDEKMRPGYGGPRQAIETCGMVEMMNSCETLITQVDGKVSWADHCENVAFNSYPAALTADMKGLRYLTAPNMPVSDLISKNPDIYNPGGKYVFVAQGHRCCQHNHAHGWPYFAEHLWLASADNGLCAMFYSESEVSAKVGSGQIVHLKQNTSYPFSDKILFNLSTSEPVDFPLYLRIPGWCKSAIVKVNGTSIDKDSSAGKYVRINRQWSDGDKIELILPMEIEHKVWKTNKNSVSINRGPLTYSLKIKEQVKRSASRVSGWDATELFPQSPWNYGLLLDSDFEVIERSWPEDNMPWTHDGAPIALKVKAKRLPNWELQANNLCGPLQMSPTSSSEPLENVELLPMGACRLRISAFPMIGEGKEWEKQNPVTNYYITQKDGHRVTVSPLHSETDNIASMFDEEIPQKSSDKTIASHIFYPKQNAETSVEIEFHKGRKIESLEIYWVQDEQNKVVLPTEVQVFYFHKEQWMPVENISTLPDQMNKLDMKLINSLAIKVSMSVPERFACGIAEIKITRQLGR